MATPGKYKKQTEIETMKIVERQTEEGEASATSMASE